MLIPRMRDAEVLMPDTSTFSYVGAVFLSILVLGLGLMPSNIFDFALQVGDYPALVILN